MTIECQGPCLLHCYYTNSIILVLIGIFIGLAIKHIYDSKLPKNRYKNR